MRNNKKSLIDLKMPPENKMRRLVIERSAKQALWLVIAFGVVLIAPYLT